MLFHLASERFPWARVPVGAFFAASCGQRLPLARCATTSLLAATASCDAPKKLMRVVPAGSSSVADFRDRFFVDKSPFIHALESTSRIVALHRPQRWGKTIFLDVLANYYDGKHAERPIVRIPGGDTPLAHSFSILRFDLASVARSVPTVASMAEMRSATMAALDKELVRAVEVAARRYSYWDNIDLAHDPMRLLTRIGEAASASGAPLYVLVDEYDALLRTLAITSGDNAVDVLAGRQGPLREFFGRFKSLHDTGLLPRVFLTGISPVGLDALTTGFNVVTDVSQRPSFNGAIGFTCADVEEALLQCLGLPKQSVQQQLIIEMLRLWGNGYLFAARLSESHGMFQSAVVVQALSELAEEPAPLTPDAVRAFTLRWTPSCPIGVAPETQLLDFFTRSGSMLALLPKLVSGNLMAAPSPLSSLSVESQVDAAAPAAEISGTERSGTLLAAVRAGQPEVPLVLEHPAEATLARTLYFEGLLTHAPQAAAALRVSNESMQRRFIERFSAHLNEDRSLRAAALSFIERGETERLASLLASLCRPRLIGQSIESWYEIHCLQRLLLLLSAVTPETGISWACEVPSFRVPPHGPPVKGFIDLLGRGRCGRRAIFIEAKQVNVVLDLAAFKAELDVARARGRKAFYQAVLRCAERLATMPLDEVKGLQLLPASIKARVLRQSSVNDVVKDASSQAQEYARGWLQRHGADAAAEVELYVVVALGPHRWLVEDVPFPTLFGVAPPSDGRAIFK